jgi:hypothetical protein
MLLHLVYESTPSNKPLKLTAAGFSQSFGLGPKRFVVAFRAAAA